MKTEHHPFENQIFEHWRNKQKQIKKAIELLKEEGYLVYEKKKI